LYCCTTSIAEHDLSPSRSILAAHHINFLIVKYENNSSQFHGSRNEKAARQLGGLFFFKGE